MQEQRTIITPGFILGDTDLFLVSMLYDTGYKLHSLAWDMIRSLVPKVIKEQHFPPPTFPVLRSSNNAVALLFVFYCRSCHLHFYAESV